MIYLIDDKKLRQEELGWTAERFKNYSNSITPIYSKEEIENNRSEIFSNYDNVIIFHESFFDHPSNLNEKDPGLIRQQLVNFSDSHNIKLIFFSGSIGGRTISGNIASTSPKIIYDNLEFFILEYQQSNKEVKIESILYGKNSKIEEILFLKKELWTLLYKSTNFIMEPKMEPILAQLEEVTGKKIDISSGSIDFIKFQINNLYIYE